MPSPTAPATRATLLPSVIASLALLALGGCSKPDRPADAPTAAPAASAASTVAVAPDSFSTSASGVSGSGAIGPVGGFTAAEPNAPTAQVDGLPAGLMSETEDSVQIVDVSPAPGAVLKRGVPQTFHMKVLYTLQSADTAIMSMSIAQIRDSGVACNVADAALIDTVEVAIERGRHQVDVTLNWSGDSGAATQGRVYGKGFLSFVPSFWQRTGTGRRHQFTGYESVCMQFGN